jgi:succinate-acetate transporter protein
MISHPAQEIKISTADPSAIGLFGLAMVTLVASSQKLGLTSGVSFVLPWAVFLGGFAQLFACIHTPSTITPSALLPLGRMRFSSSALARHGSSR